MADIASRIRAALLRRSSGGSAAAAAVEAAASARQAKQAAAAEVARLAQQARRNAAGAISDTLDSAASEADMSRRAAAEAAQRSFSGAGPATPVREGIDVAAARSRNLEAARANSPIASIADEIMRRIDEATSPNVGSLGVSDELSAKPEFFAVSRILQDAVDEFGGDAAIAFRAVVAPKLGIDSSLPTDQLVAGVADAQRASWTARQDAARAAGVELASGPSGQQLNAGRPEPTDRPGPRPDAPIERLNPIVENTNTLEPIEIRNPVTGEIKVGADGQPIVSLAPDGLPRFQQASSSRITANRQIGDESVPVAGQEFTQVAIRRNDSNGNRSDEVRAWILPRGEGVYQLTTIGPDGSPIHKLIDDKFLRDMAHEGFVHSSGPNLPALRPAEWDETSARTAGRALFDAMQAGEGSNPTNIAQLASQLRDLRSIGDGSLFRAALDEAGFRAGPDASAREALGAELFSRASDVVPPATRIPSVMDAAAPAPPASSYDLKREEPIPAPPQAGAFSVDAGVDPRASLTPASRLLGAGSSQAGRGMSAPGAISVDTSTPTSGAFPFFESAIGGLGDSPAVGLGGRFDWMPGFGRQPQTAGTMNFDVEPDSWAASQARSPLNDLLSTPTTFTTSTMDFGALGGQRARLDEVGSRVRQITDQLLQMRGGRAAKKGDAMLPGEAALIAERNALYDEDDRLRALLSSSGGPIDASAPKDRLRPGTLASRVQEARAGVLPIEFGTGQSAVGLQNAGQVIPVPGGSIFGTDGSSRMPQLIEPTADVPPGSAVQEAVMPAGSVRLPEQPIRVAPTGAPSLLDRVRSLRNKGRAGLAAPEGRAMPQGRLQAELNALAAEEASIRAYRAQFARASDEAGDLANDALSHAAAERYLKTYLPFRALSPEAKARVIEAAGSTDDVQRRILALDPEAKIDYGAKPNAMPTVVSPRAREEEAIAFRQLRQARDTESALRGADDGMEEHVADDGTVKLVPRGSAVSEDPAINMDAASRQASSEAEAQRLLDMHEAEMASRAADTDISPADQRRLAREILGLDDDYAIQTEPDDITIHPDTGGIILPEITPGATQPVYRRAPPAFQVIESRPSDARPSEAALERMQKQAALLERARDKELQSLHASGDRALDRKAELRVQRKYQKQLRDLANQFSGDSEVQLHSAAQNRSRLIASLTQTRGPNRIEVVRELFGDRLVDGLASLQRLAQDGRLGSVEDIVRRVLQSDPAIRDAFTPEALADMASDAASDVRTALRQRPNLEPSAPAASAADQPTGPAGPVRRALQRLMALLPQYQGSFWPQPTLAAADDPAKPFLSALPSEAEILAAGTDATKLNELLQRTNAVRANVQVYRTSADSAVDLSQVDQEIASNHDLIARALGKDEVDSGAGGWQPDKAEAPAPAAPSVRSDSDGPDAVAVREQALKPLRRKILDQIKAENPNKASDASWLKAEANRRFAQLVDSKTALPIQPASFAGSSTASFRVSRQDAERLRNYLTPSFYLDDAPDKGASARMDGVPKLRIERDGDNYFIVATARFTTPGGTVVTRTKQVPARMDVGGSDAVGHVVAFDDDMVPSFYDGPSVRVVDNRGGGGFPDMTAEEATARLSGSRQQAASPQSRPAQPVEAAPTETRQVESAQGTARGPETEAPPADPTGRTDAQPEADRPAPESRSSAPGDARPRETSDTPAGGGRQRPKFLTRKNAVKTGVGALALYGANEGLRTYGPDVSGLLGGTAYAGGAMPSDAPSEPAGDTKQGEGRIEDRIRRARRLGYLTTQNPFPRS